MIQVTALEPNSQLVTHILHALYLIPAVVLGLIFRSGNRAFDEQKVSHSHLAKQQSQNTPLCPGHNPDWSAGFTVLCGSTFIHFALVVP